MILETQGQPFDLALTLDAGQTFRWSKESDNGGWWNGVIRGQLIRIRQRDDGNLEFDCAPGPDAGVKEMLRRYFRLDDDIGAIYASISRDYQMAELVHRYHGLRLMRQEPWECLISYICSRRNSVERIAQSVENLSEKWGEALKADNIIRHAFPTPASLAGAGISDLDQAITGIPELVECVQLASHDISAGRVTLDGLEKETYPNAISELRKLKGVGPKISNCVALFSLDKLDAFPIDTHIGKGLRGMYPQNQGIRDANLHNWARDYFGPYAGYAGQFVFHHYRTMESG